MKKHKEKSRIEIVTDKILEGGFTEDELQEIISLLSILQADRK